MAEVAIEIPSRSVYVGVVRLALASLARSAGFDEEAVDDLKIAVGEACANAVLANEEAGSGAPVSVLWRDDDGEVVVEIGDRGATYDPSPAAGAGVGGPDATRLEMSIALVQSLVENCEIVPREGGGMCARLRFPLP